MTENTTASGAAGDSLLLCASDLQHSAIYDNPHEMVDCVRAVADRITGLAASAPVAPTQPTVFSDEQIKAHGDKASGMMARDMTRFDAACEVMKYLKEQGTPYYYMHRMSIVLHGNDEGTEAARAPDKAAPAPQPARLMFPNPVDIFAAMSDTAKARTSPENVADVLMALAAAGMQTQAAPLQQDEYLPLPECDATTVGLGAVWNRHGVRAAIDADRAARGVAQAAPAPVAEDAEDAARWRLLPLFMQGYDVDWVELLYNLEVTFKRGVRAQAAQPEGGAES